MLTTTEIQLSTNKRDYSPASGSHQLSSKDIDEICQYYARQNISLYAETYLPIKIQHNIGNSAIAKIQNQLADNEYAGYLNTEGKRGHDTSHVECLIIAKDKIIKPIEWHAVRHGAIEIDHYPNAVDADLYKFTQSACYQPQSDILTCASLSISYLKQLLKNDAEQLKNLTLSVPYFRNTSFNQSSSLCHFFVPSPQVLRYSQSSTYNEYIAALVLEEDPGFFKHQYKWIAFTTLKNELERTLYTAKQKNLPDLIKEVQQILYQLPTFREKWKTAFEQMRWIRSLMDDHSGFNRTLAYTSQRLRKIALFEQERLQNPGLILLNEIKAYKESHHVSNEELLLFFSGALSTLNFKSQAELSFFLNRLGDLIEGTLVYPVLFQYQNYFKMINHVDMYRESKFFLNAIQRDILNNYLKSSPQFVSLLNQQQKAKQTISFIEKINALNLTEERKKVLLEKEIIEYNIEETLSWLDLLAIPEHNKLAFLQERIPKESVATSLIDCIIYGHSVEFLHGHFKDKNILLTFLNYYIDIKDIIPLLPMAIKNYISTLNILFSSKNEFAAFIDQYMPLDMAVTYLQDDPYFRVHFSNYLTCIDPDKRSILILRQLNDFSSSLFKKISSLEQHPRCVLEYLEEYCSEGEIASYLNTHRDYLLDVMMQQLRIYPLNLENTLHNIAEKIQFFSSKNSYSLAVYQKTLVPCDQDRLRCLVDVLGCLPQRERQEFIKDVFQQLGDEQLLSIFSLNQIKPLLSECKEELQKNNVSELAKLNNYYNNNPKAEKDLLNFFQDQDVNKMKFCQYAWLALKASNLITDANINVLKNVNDINKFYSINRLYSKKILNTESFNALFSSECILSSKIADYLIILKKEGTLYRDLSEIKNIIKTLEFLKINNLLDANIELFILNNNSYCNDLLMSVQYLKDNAALAHFSILKKLCLHDQANRMKAVCQIIVDCPELINKINHNNADVLKIYAALTRFKIVDLKKVPEIFIDLIITHVDYAMDLVHAYNMISNEVFAIVPNAILECFKNFPQENVCLAHALLNLNKLELIDSSKNEDLFKILHMTPANVVINESNPILAVIVQYPTCATEIVSALAELKKFNLLNKSTLFILLNTVTSSPSLDIAWSIKKLEHLDLLSALHLEDIKAVSRIKRKESKPVLELIHALLRQIKSLYDSKKSLSFYFMNAQKIDEKIEEYRLQIYKIANTESDFDLLEIAKNLKKNNKLIQTCNVLGFSLFNSATTTRLNTVQEEFVQRYSGSLTHL